MEVSQWRDELRIDLRKWRDGKPTKKGICLTLMRWKNCINQLEYMDRALDNKTSYEYHIGGNVYCTIAENGVCVCGYKAVLETWGPGGTYHKRDLFKTIGIRSFERTVTRNRKRFTGTGWGDILFITE